MDHSDEERAFEALSAELSRTDPGWQRRWRLAPGLLASCSPSWARLAASFMLLMVDAALLVVMVASGQRGVLVGVAAVFAVGMQQLGRGQGPRQARPPASAGSTTWTLE